MSDEEEDMVCDLPTDSKSTKVGGGLLRQALTHGLPPPPPKQRNTKEKDLSPLPWSEFFDEKRRLIIGEDEFNVYLKGTTGPIIYFLHGGGYSGLTWACLAKEVSNLLECRILAPDLRGHGDSLCLDEHDLSKETQIKDIGAIFEKVYGNSDENQVCIVGHSMGGALAVHSVCSSVLKAKIVGMIVIDVVEGSAMEALSGMVHFLHSRPSSFDSVEKAINWCVHSGTARNSIAARVSMPAQIRAVNENELTWRIDLTATEPFWKGWFQQLSTEFLSCHIPKLLVLAGVDRLDRELTIGQMQGKFQTCVLPKVGHCVQEDSPDRLADEMARFATRYQFARPTPNFSSNHDSLRATAKHPMSLGAIL